MKVYHASLDKNDFHISTKGSIGNGYIYLSTLKSDVENIHKKIDHITEAYLKIDKILVMDEDLCKELKIDYKNQYKDLGLPQDLFKFYENALKNPDLNHMINKILYYQLMKTNKIKGIIYPHKTELKGLEVVVKPEASILEISNKINFNRGDKMNFANKNELCAELASKLSNILNDEKYSQILNKEELHKVIDITLDAGEPFTEEYFKDVLKNNKINFSIMKFAINEPKEGMIVHDEEIDAEYKILEVADSEYSTKDNKIYHLTVRVLKAPKVDEMKDFWKVGSVIEIDGSTEGELKNCKVKNFSFKKYTSEGNASPLIKKAIDSLTKEERKELGNCLFDESFLCNEFIHAMAEYAYENKDNFSNIKLPVRVRNSKE